MPPLKDSQYCWVHSPEHASEVKEARRLGGLRRRRETAISDAYEFESLTSVEGIRRVLQIAVLDTLAAENSLSRNRTLAYLVMVALKALETGDLEERVALEEITRA